MTTCSKDATGPDDDPLETILSNMTIVIDPELVPILEFVEGRITFENNNTPATVLFLAALIPDIILVCPPCEQVPNGFLRRITSIDQGFREISVDTEQGT